MVRILCIVLLLSCGTACREKPATVFAGPVVPISPALLAEGIRDTMRLGSLYSGETVRREFGIRNDGKRPAAIVAVERSCGCLTLEYDPQPILPGEVRRAALLFDTGGFRGWQFKQLSVRFADGAEPMRIYVEADVR